jgi:S-adenosylmethionine decarboxylase proenzyme
MMSNGNSVEVSNHVLYNMSVGTPVGVHLLVNVYDVPNLELLQHMSVGVPVLDTIVRGLHFNVVSQTGFQFPPIGYSYAYVLSESHFTIHTYPEYNSCYIDMFCCNPSFNPHMAVDRIKREFHTNNVRFQIIRR